MKQAWFVYLNDVVTGPLSTAEVQEKLRGNLIPMDGFIWCRGEREWMPLSQWETRLPDLIEAHKEQAEARAWYLDLGSGSIGPLLQAEVLDNLKGLQDFRHARVWTAGMKTWTKIYEVHDIMEPLGISRRVNTRAPLTGTVVVTRARDETKSFMLRAASVSVAGIGVNGTHDLCKDDRILLVIKSPDLPGSIHLSGEVAYVNTQGYAGVRFETVPAEIQTLLYDYVKRFNPENATEQLAS